MLHDADFCLPCFMQLESLSSISALEQQLAAMTAARDLEKLAKMALKKTLEQAAHLPRCLSPPLLQLAPDRGDHGFVSLCLCGWQEREQWTAQHAAMQQHLSSLYKLELLEETVTRLVHPCACRKHLTDSVADSVTWS